MTNPKDQITSYLNSLKRKFSVKGRTLTVADASIEFLPDINSSDCSQVIMRMAKKSDSNAFHNSAMLFVLIDKMMGSDFKIDTFLSGLETTKSSISAIHDGVSVSIDPTVNPWIIEFKPA